MSFVSTDGINVNESGADFFGSWGGETAFLPEDAVWFLYGIGGPGPSKTSEQGMGSSDGSYSDHADLISDRSYQVKARGFLNGSFRNGSVVSFKSFALVATANAPSATSITKNSATISDVFDAKVTESSFSAAMYYRKFGDSTWINGGTTVTSGTTVSANISGLLGNTIYEMIMIGSRSTENSTDWRSPIGSFTTLVDTPTLTTDAASVITESTAVLNGTINPNGLVLRVRFGWGLADGGAVPASWANLTAYQAFSGSTSQGFEQAISGLSQSTLYFFRAFVEWPSPGYANGSSGISRSFTSAVNPLAAAALEDHVFIMEFDGHYGVQSDFYFALPSPGGTSSDRYVTTAPGTLFAAGDIKLSKDGAAFANITNAIVQVLAGNPLLKLTLTAAEMQTELGLVMIVDQNGPAFRDLLIIVRTKQRLGQLLVNASQVGSSAAAVVFQPSVGGYSLDLQDGAGTNIGKMRGFFESMSLRANTCQAGGASTATLDASASATNSYYNEDILLIVGGTGAGQSRVITGYDGTTKVATVNAAWSVNPDNTSRYVILPGGRTMSLVLPELASIPAAGAAVGLKIQLLFQRFAFKVTQTATVQTLYTSAGVSLGTRSVSDDGTTQSIQKVV